MTLDELSQQDQAFLRGCLIGDGWLGLQRNQYAHLRIGHSVKQLEWLKWKANRINAIIGSNRRVLGPYYQGSGRKDGKKYESYLHVVDNHELFVPWYQRWYCIRNGKTCKIIDKDFLEGLDLQALAILWCDDGTITSSERQAKHKLADGSYAYYPYVEGKGAIATCSFADEENRLLIDWIESLTGVRFKLHRSRGYPVLSIGKRALRELIPQIQPYVPDCMSYKVDTIHCRV